jgi:hypothetical protein
MSSRSHLDVVEKKNVPVHAWNLTPAFEPIANHFTAYNPRQIQLVC